MTAEAVSSRRKLEIQQERLALQKKLCEHSLAEFVRAAWRFVDPSPYCEGKHVRVIAQHLEAMTRNELHPDRVAKLLINIPPGHMKSILVNVMWPAWAWGPGGHPEHRFVFTSYREDLAMRDADKARELIGSKWYQYHWGDVFDIPRNKDTKARYQNSARGYRFSAPVAGIMGEGGDFVIMDDPHNVQQAESEAVRESTVELLKLALPTRVRNPAGGYVVIMQRLHARDFAGVMIDEEYDEWDHLCMPGRYEHDHPHPFKSSLGVTDWRTKDGELLFPELWPDDRVTSLERTLGLYGFAGQFQQRPTAREGGMFKREWFNGTAVDWSMVPPLVRRVRSYDLASRTGTRADFTAWCYAGRGEDGNMYVLDVGHSREESFAVRRRIQVNGEKDHPRTMVTIPQDPGQAGVSQVEDIVRENPGLHISPIRPSGSKETRAEPAASHVPFGMVKFVNQPGLNDFIEELCAFPMGAYDDQVDAFADAYNELMGGVQYASGPTTARA